MKTLNVVFVNVSFLTDSERGHMCCCVPSNGPQVMVVTVSPL